jgi:hypothetical protein
VHDRKTVNELVARACLLGTLVASMLLAACAKAGAPAAPLAVMPPASKGGQDAGIPSHVALWSMCLALAGKPRSERVRAVVTSLIEVTRGTQVETKSHPRRVQPSSGAQALMTKRDSRAGSSHCGWAEQGSHGLRPENRLRPRRGSGAEPHVSEHAGDGLCGPWRAERT